VKKARTVWGLIDCETGSFHFQTESHNGGSCVHAEKEKDHIKVGG